MSISKKAETWSAKLEFVLISSQHNFTGGFDFFFFYNMDNDTIRSNEAFPVT